MSKKVLGRGLDALIPQEPIPQPTITRAQNQNPTAPGPSPFEIPLRDIVPNPDQPRREFDESALHELAASIREFGVIEPVLVRAKGDHYVLVAGERRVRASRLAGKEMIPAIVRNDADQDMLIVALIENIQREDLNPIEEAEAYRQLMDQLSLTQDAVAGRVGKSRASIANSLRLLQLSPPIRADLSSGRITAGHARAILLLESGDERDALWKAIKGDNLTVRASEQVARDRSPKPRRIARKASSTSASADPLMAAFEDRMRERLGTQIKIHRMGKGGRLEIRYHDVADLNRLAELMGVPDDE